MSASETPFQFPAQACASTLARNKGPVSQFGIRRSRRSYTQAMQADTEAAPAKITWDFEGSIKTHLRLCRESWGSEATKLWSGAAKRPLRRMVSVDAMANPAWLDIVRQIVTDGVERIADLAAEASHCCNRA